MMLIKLNGDLQQAVERTVRMRMAESIVIDVASTAEEIRRAFADLNVAHEDIAASVTRFAVTCGYPLQLSAAAAKVN